MDGLLPELVVAMTHPNPEAGDARNTLDAMLVDVVDYVAREYPHSAHELALACLKVHDRYRSSGQAVARKRFGLVRTLAPSVEHLKMVDALEYAVERKLSQAERDVFRRVQQRWSHVVANAGTCGTPDFSSLVCRCVVELHMCLPRNVAAHARAPGGADGDGGGDGDGDGGAGCDGAEHSDADA